jgi:hypothetical protein
MGFQRKEKEKFHGISPPNTSKEEPKGCSQNVSNNFYSNIRQKGRLRNI